MLTLVVMALGILAGVLLGYRLGCQRVIREVAPDAPDLPAPMSPHRAAEEWHKQHTRRAVSEDS